MIHIDEVPDEDVPPPPQPHAGGGDKNDALRKIGFSSLGEAIGATAKSPKQQMAETEAARSEIISRTTNIVERAMEIRKLSGGFDLPDYTVAQETHTYLNTDRNRKGIIAAVLSEDEAIHFNEYNGHVVDHKGVVIDKMYPTGEWLEVFAAAGLRHKHSVKFTEARATLREVGFGRKQNDFVMWFEKRIPQWDGTPRLDTYLWTLFDAFDTPLNRLLSRYFWLSLYGRIMRPGCEAPISLVFIGDQKSGKSYFGLRLAQIITGDEKVGVVSLNLSRQDQTNFLRRITGASPIAAMAEMAGFDIAKLETSKEFATITVDVFDFKWEGTIKQPRQWIIIGDTNSYKLQRDATGNRRWAPMFVGQLPDRGGKPQWRIGGQKINAGPFIASKQFEADFFQLMAEAAAWMEREGEDGYAAMVNEAGDAVQEFSRSEMARNSGTLRNARLDRAFLSIVSKCQPQEHKRGVKNPNGVKIAVDEFERRCIKVTGSPSNGALGGLMIEHGGRLQRLTGNIEYLFWPYWTLEDFQNAMNAPDGDGWVAKPEPEF